MQLLLQLALTVVSTSIAPSSAIFSDPSTRSALPLAFTPSRSSTGGNLHRHQQHNIFISKDPVLAYQRYPNAVWHRRGRSNRQPVSLIVAVTHREHLDDDVKSSSSGPSKGVASPHRIKLPSSPSPSPSSSPLAVPRHVAIIPDGNGRWAQARGLPRSAGHAAGVKRVIEAVNVCKEAGVERLSLFAFSTENWERKPREVETILSLVEQQLRDLRASFKDQNIRVLVFGQRSRLPPSLRTLLRDIDKDNADMESSFTNFNSRRSTKSAAAEQNCDIDAAASAFLSPQKEEQKLQEYPWEFTLALALSYGGRSACATAAQRLALHVQEGNLNPADIDEQVFAAALGTTEDEEDGDSFGFGAVRRRERAETASSSVDLCLRTGGERRLSNFLLYEMAYAELDFVDEPWPEFSPKKLRESLQRFSERQRRFGKETTQEEAN